MSELADHTPTAAATAAFVAGVVVHPSRNVDHPLEELMAWVSRHDAVLTQIPVLDDEPHVAPAGRAADCDLVVSIGGDGTMLGAIRAAVPAGRPVLGVGCGSLGVLTTTAAADLGTALDRFTSGDWQAQTLPALAARRADGDELLAINDLAVVRDGVGQVRTAVTVDGVPYSRLAGDGCIVSTPIGSGAYAIAAGGPLLDPSVEAFLVTPLSAHGGFSPPLVVSASAEVELDVRSGVGGARLEIDGQVVGGHDGTLAITLRPAVATVVSFAGEEPYLARLRRRGIVVDSPRILAEQQR